jgi:hypothetical protein
MTYFMEIDMKIKLSQKIKGNAADIKTIGELECARNFRVRQH